MIVSASIESFVAQARAALPHEPIAHYKVRTYGNSAAIADVIIPLILKREKTGTFALESEFEHPPELAPTVGDYYVVTRFTGEPVLLYRITEVQRVAFNDINHEHVQVEGPNARTVPVWRKIHWDYWGQILRQQGRTPDERMPVLFQRFEVLYPAG